MNLSMIDLFSGIGGIRIAFENHGVKCVASSEIDKYACETYYDNFKEMPLGDVSKLEKSDLPDFDILAGGFPCQPFSLAGLRKGFEDARGTLFFEVARLLKSCKPKAFLLENVQGLVNHDKGNTIRTIEDVLKDVGYNFRWQIMNAKDYGVPQNRSRWYCVGFRNDLCVGFADQEDIPEERRFCFPKKKKLDYTLSDILSKETSEEYNSSETAIRNINYHIDKRNLIVSPSMIAYEVRPSKCSFRDDNISPCLTAKMGTGGNNVPIVVSEHRKLTEQECLRIMGFPEWFRIKPNNSHSYKQIGNSVVVPVVSLLAKELVRVIS